MAFDNTYTAVTGATYAAADYNTGTKGNFSAVWVGTTAGDMDYYLSATTKNRIAVGSIGDVLTIKSANTPGWSSVYPVGSIYISTLATNPATLFGFGTWTAFGAGRTLVGLDAGQTEFDVVEETGGAKTVTLSVAQMPVHAHDTLVPSLANYDNSSDTGSLRHVNASAQVTTSTSMGGGTSHTNLQPYIVVYFWKRTA